MKNSIFILLSVFLCGCSGEQIENYEIDSLEDDSLLSTKINNNLKSEKAPGQSGVYVVRYSLQGILAYTLVDFNSNLTLTTNYPGLPTYCGGDFPMDIVNVQDVISGNNSLRHLILAEGEVQAKVYLGSFDWNGDIQAFCDFLSNAPLIAEGTASILYHDNDIYATYDPLHTAAFGFRVQGKLETPEGKIKHLSAMSNFLWSIDDEDANSILDVLMNVSVKLN
ncbi:MAG: hypothetical protein R3213_07195 [Flavobacteriaceae bacterium]|nr:hypothetical protein [Flavobacteriaceae bacterium]